MTKSPHTVISSSSYQFGRILSRHSSVPLFGETSSFSWVSGGCLLGLMAPIVVRDSDIVQQCSFRQVHAGAMQLLPACSLLTRVRQQG